MEKNLADEIKELNKRINELEKMLSMLMQPLRDVGKTASNYLRLTGLLLDHGGLTPDIILPDLVRNKRGTASRRIIRKRMQELTEKKIVKKYQKGSIYVYVLSEEVVKKWSQMLGFNI